MQSGVAYLAVFLYRDQSVDKNVAPCVPQKLDPARKCGVSLINLVFIDNARHRCVHSPLATPPSRSVYPSAFYIFGNARRGNNYGLDLFKGRADIGARNRSVRAQFIRAPHRRGNWTIPVTARHTAHYLSRIIMNWFVNENTCFPALASIYAFHRVYFPSFLSPSLPFSRNRTLALSLARLSFHPRFNPLFCPPCSLFPRIYASNGSITLSSRSGIRVYRVFLGSGTNWRIQQTQRKHCNFYVFTLRYGRASYDTTCGIHAKWHFEDNLDSLSEKDLGNLFYRHLQGLVNQAIFVATSRLIDGAWKIQAHPVLSMFWN